MRRVLALIAAAITLSLLLGYVLGASAQEKGVRIVVNGKKIQCNPPAFIQDGRVFVPLRFVAEALGAKVEWNGAESTVLITHSFTISTLAIQTPEGTRVITFPAFSDQLVK